MRSIRLLLLSLAMSIVLPACAALAAAVSITDDAGRTVEMAQPAQRIVLTDGMGLIGLAAVARNPVGLLAGWNKGRLDTDVLEAFRRDGPAIDAVPDIGELRSGSAAVEALIALRPDLVVLDPYYRSAVAIRQLEAAGIAVAVLALTPSVRDAEPAYGIKRLSMLIGRRRRDRRSRISLGRDWSVSARGSKGSARTTGRSSFWRRMPAGVPAASSPARGRASAISSISSAGAISARTSCPVWPGRSAPNTSSPRPLRSISARAAPI